MKLSTWHKAQGDSVEWYQPMFSGHMDKVYMSKVFSFTPDYEYYVDADEVVKGGTGYAITLGGGYETYDKSKDADLPQEIEHIYPDYSLYPQFKDTAYGFLTRGCPRGCHFCHVKSKEGHKSYKVADLSEFWRGQKKIVLCDPNILACQEWKDLLQQLIDSKAIVEFNQGLDIRLMTEEKADLVSKLRTKIVHFAWDRYEDKDKVVPKLKMFKEISGWDRHKLVVYMLVNFDSTIEQDLERVYVLREMDYAPYVMVYDKAHAPLKIRKLQRWVNNRVIFYSTSRFEDYYKER